MGTPLPHKEYVQRTTFFFLLFMELVSISTFGIYIYEALSLHGAFWRIYTTSRYFHFVPHWIHLKVHKLPSFLCVSFHPLLLSPRTLTFVAWYYTWHTWSCCGYLLLHTTWWTPGALHICADTTDSFFRWSFVVLEKTKSILRPVFHGHQILI